MKTKISHIIHPGIVDPSSDLVVAQPITFRSMQIACDFSEKMKGPDVSLYAIQYSDEERVSLPESFSRVADLRRSITDLKTFVQKRKLALIRDILDELYRVSTGVDYLVYTNVDIALQPTFYLAVDEFIKQGYDAFVINRRTISDRYLSVAQLPLMWAELGESHKGYDCFVIRRDQYPEYNLGNICIGTAWIGRALLANMVAFSDNFKEFKNQHLSFHIGDSCQWRNTEFADYMQANRAEYLRVFAYLEKKRGTFSPVWRSYLLDAGGQRQFPEFSHDHRFDSF